MLQVSGEHFDLGRPILVHTTIYIHLLFYTATNYLFLLHIIRGYNFITKPEDIRGEQKTEISESETAQNR